MFGESPQTRIGSRTTTHVQNTTSFDTLSSQTNLARNKPNILPDPDDHDA